MIWGGESPPYFTEIIIDAQKTDRVMDGPELVTIEVQAYHVLPLKYKSRVQVY